jgi:Ca2+-binding RTX toxin-like protein
MADITGTGGDDVLTGTSGADTISGLEGNDTIYTGGPPNPADPFNGIDTIDGGAGTDTLVLNAVGEPQNIYRGALWQYLFLDPATLVSVERLAFDSHAGELINAVFYPGTFAASGITELVGGAGSDNAVFLVSGSNTYTLPALTLTNWSAAPVNAWDASTADSLALIALSDPGANITINALAGVNAFQVLAGLAGNDTINGSGNADYISGGGGFDQLFGNGGNDAFEIVNGSTFLPALTGAGSTFNGGAGTDVLTIGGSVNFQGTMTGIEGIDLLPEFVSQQPNVQGLPPAVLTLDTAHLAMLPGNAFFRGSGTVILERDDNASFSLSGYTVEAGSSVAFEIVACDGNGLTLTGAAGNDTIRLGSGNQAAVGGGGDDRFVFGSGTQSASGGDGADHFVPNLVSGAATVTDFAFGTDSIDFFNTPITNLGRLHDLTIAETAGGLTISGQSGGQSFSTTFAGLTLAQFNSLTETDLNFGYNRILGGSQTGTSANDLLYGTSETDQLYGGAGNDRLYSETGLYDELYGDDGNDTLIIDGFGQGQGIFDGGAGTDTLLFRSYIPLEFGTVVHHDMTAATVSGIERLGFDTYPGYAPMNVRIGLPVAIGIGEVAGGAAFDILTMVATAPGDYTMPALNLVDWDPNSDILALEAPWSGFGGDVTLRAREGLASHQMLIGGGGGHVLIGSSGSDTLQNGGFNYGGLGDDNYIVFGGQSQLIFELAGEGYDNVLSYASFYLFDNLESLALAPGQGELYGVGNALDNYIVGNESANLLIGGLGDDTFYGFEGNDLIFGEDGADMLNGNDGVDYLAGGNGDDSLYGGSEADALYGEDGNDQLYAGDYFVTDILVGGAGHDTLVADSGAVDYDLLDGGGGDDTYYVDTGADLTFEAVNGGTDTVWANVPVANAGVYLYANVENLILQGDTAFGVGNELNNQITGSQAANLLLGGAGNDRIDGGQGNDLLFGEAGADTFVFVGSTGQDVIGDFSVAEDRIQLGNAFSSFAQVQGNMVQVGADMAIDFGYGLFVVLQGVNKDNLTADNFVFASGAAAPAASKAPLETAHMELAFAAQNDLVWQPELHGSPIYG